MDGSISVYICDAIEMPHTSNSMLLDSNNKYSKYFTHVSMRATG